MSFSASVDLQAIRSSQLLIADHPQPVVKVLDRKQFGKVQSEPNAEESTGPYPQHKAKSEAFSLHRHHRHKGGAHKGEHEGSEKEAGPQQHPKRKLVEEH